MAFNLPSDEFGRAGQLPPNKVRVSPEGSFSVTTTPSVQKTVVQGEYIEVHSETADLLLKYGTTACTTSNFDERIKAGTYRTYIVPNGATAVNFITAANTASVILIRK